MKHKLSKLLILITILSLSVVTVLTACTPIEEVSYTITWQNYDGTVLATQTLKNGELPTYDGETPVKEGDAQYSYTFSGWDNEVVAVTADATYVAQFNATVNTYTVTWKNGDDVLETDTVEYGAVPTYDGETPVKEGDAQYSYTFKGWNTEVVAVKGNITYTAQFTSSVNTYTVTWKNGDEVLETDTVEYGAVPTYDGEAPIKEGDAQYTHNFIGWDSEVVAVTGDVVYTAQFETTVTTYTVLWKDGDKVLETDTVEYGAVPTYDGAQPSRNATNECTYTFKGWDKEVVAVTGDAVYNAVFDINARELYKAINGNLVVDDTNVYDNQAISYKFTASAWDLKWSLDDSFSGLIEDSFTIYLKFEETKECTEEPSLFYGPADGLASTLALADGEWVALTIDATKYYQITSLDYIFQVRAGENIAGCNLYVSLMPELEVYDLPIYGSNAMPQVSTDIKYGNEDHSYKFKTGSDFRLFFNSNVLSALPADATYVSFYVYHTKASNVNYQYIQSSPSFTAFDKVSLASNAWTKVTLTRAEVKNMCNDSDNYFVRAQDWDSSVTYYVSGLYFEDRWFRDYSPSAQPFSLETTEVYPGDSKAWKIERTSAEPCWIQLEAGLMDIVPASATQIYFYVKTDKVLEVQYINDNNTADGEAWSTVLATTVANNWVKVTLTRTQFERMCATPAKYRIRVNQWATGTYYLSEIHWAEDENRIATYNNSTATKGSIEGVDADLCVTIQANAWTGQMSLTEAARIDESKYSAVKVYVLAYGANTQADSNPLKWSQKEFTQGVVYEETITVAAYNYLIYSEQSILFMNNKCNSSANGLSWTIAFEYVE